MDAVYSGQAGVMALLEGAEVRVRRADNYDAEFTVGREGVAYLFRGCTDVVLVKGAREDALRVPFEEAWNADRALRLFLISLDPEEDRELRAEAADCLEDLLVNPPIKTSIENEFYSRALPDDIDHAFLSVPERWELISELVGEITRNQPSIKARRKEWDDLPTSLFQDDNKTGFEESAIRHGAFRMLASVDPNSENRNMAIFQVFKALSRVPNSRVVVNEWTANFKRPGSKQIVFEDEADEAFESDVEIDGHAAFEHSKAQREAIAEKLKRGSLNLARRYADQLVRFQLENGGPEYAAKSLCDLAQAAKYLELHSVQLEWALRAADINPTDSWARGQAADALIEFSRLDEALNELAACEKLGDAQFAAGARARILRHQGKLDEALAAFRAVRGTFKGHKSEPYTWWGAAETLRDMWKVEEALGEYERGIAEFPAEGFLLCGRAAVLAELGRFDEAIAAYKARELQSDLVSLNGIAAVLKDQGKLKEAQDAIAIAIELYPSAPISRCHQAEILRLQGDFQGALQLYDFVRLTYPTMTVAFSGYAEVLRDMKKLPEAIAAYEGAVERFPDDARLADGYANIRKVNDEFAESLRIYERNVKRFPYDLVGKSGRADLLKRLGRYEDAIDAYDGILQIWPGYEAARNGKAAILVIRGRYDEAISLLPSGKPLTANDWVGWHIRGMVMLRKNALDDAVEFLEEAHKTIPFAREKRYFDGALGIARLRQSKFEQAALALVDSAGGLSNVLRFHAHAGMGNVARAQTLYGELKNRCPAQIIDIRDAIAGRFGLAPAVAAHNDNWIFGREMEAMLQEAA